MLKGIPGILSPDLLKVLCEMGHGDEIVLADGNFPKFAHPEIVIRCDGHGTAELMDALLSFFPLDGYVEKPVVYMDVLPDDPYVPEIWDKYRKIIQEKTNHPDPVEKINKFTFYERAQKAYAVIATTEQALYANVIIKKGVVE